MFRRLFGETEEEQLKYLKTRVILTLGSIALMIVGGLIVGLESTGGFAVIMLFVWGWGAVKALFGFASAAALFSGNVIIGSMIFLLYAMIAYLAGIFCAAVGTGRYFYLLIKRKKEAG